MVLLQSIAANDDNGCVGKGRIECPERAGDEDARCIAKIVEIES